MATIQYRERYRKLRRIYEAAYGKFVSDQTWYHVTRSVRECLKIQIMDSKAEYLYGLLGSMKRELPSFAIKSTFFPECWAVFQHYKQKDGEMTCAGFLADLLKYLDIEVRSRNTWQCWFTSAAVSYRRNQRRKVADLALVAFLAARWRYNRRQETLRENLREIEKRTIDVEAV